MAAPTILHEETNYARLNLAIRTTCAFCLKDVLIKNVPRGFTDIYDAVFCMRNQLKKQISIQHFFQLFPQNSPNPAFTVTNCDIPLLYSLIRNVSSVPPPITGWGKPVMDQPRDSSVGANVERLRDRRNYIVHLLEPKVSNHDFHKLWEEVTHCIVDIEGVLGGNEHQQKLIHLKIDDLDPSFVTTEINNVKRIVQEIQEKQNQKQDHILEIRQDQAAHGSILNDIARMQNEHDDILDVLKAGQGNNITALCNIQKLLNNNQVTAEELKNQITLQSQYLGQGIESLACKLGQVLQVQGQLKDQKIKTHGNHEEKELSAPNQVLNELPSTNQSQTLCLEESTINQACKGQTMIVPDSTLGQESSKDMSVTDNSQPQETVENSSLPNWTIDEIVMVWPSIETLLLEDLFPKLVMSFFEKGNIFSKDECDMIRRKTGRRAMTKELISIMKDRLPRSFVVLFHALNETDQQDISNELKCIIKRGPVNEAPVSNSHYFTVTAKVKQDGRTLQTVEYQINTHINQNLQILLPVTFEVVGSRMGSVIIYLRANGRNSYDAMVAFCKHGGMKNFILSLLKEKKVFKSLPAGEISIEIQVHQDKEDLNYEAKQFEAMKNVRITESECFLFCPAVDAADESCVIKENLLLQYEYVADEIDPLHFAEIFVSRGILDESFFKELKHYRRGKRAVLFLNKVLEKGKDALYALTEDLKNKGCEDLVNKLCFAHGRSKEQWNKGNLDGNLIQVELEVTYKYFEDLMWSCRLRCEAEKDIYVMATTSQKLKVSNIPHGVTSDALQLLFENRKRSGGGKVKSLDFDTGLATAVIEFEDPSVIDRVLEKLPLAIQGQQLKMEIYKEIDESEKVVEEEDERIDLPKTTVEVSGFSQDTSKDSLEMYFENNKWSGGGPISNIDWKDKVALITFESEAVANAVLQKSHKFDGMDLKVKLYVPPPPVSMYKDKFLITGLNEKVTEDVLFNLLEARSGVSPTEILYAEDDDELKALVTFESPPGRARAMDSKYHALAQIGKGTAAKEEVNIRREKLMAKAINELQGDIQQNPPSIRKNIRKLQEEDKLDRDLQTQQKK